MSQPNRMFPVPPIPTALAHLPTVGGLAVPWITPRTADGRYLFGAIDHHLARRALLEHRCGVCGTRLHDRVVLLMRLSDLPRHATNEPPLHPPCAAYTTSACPMIAGRLSRYRSTPRAVDKGMQLGENTDARLGARAEPWFAVWLRSYHIAHADSELTASYAGQRPLRIRPITWRIPPVL